MTWWTILIEGALALFCLWPGNGLVAIIRSLVTLVFAASTYLLAPVMGFGWMVIIMGFAQAPEKYQKLRASFIVVLLVIYVYRMKLVGMGLDLYENEFAEMVRFF